MARTKASVGAKISSGKSSKARCCNPAPSSSAGTSSGSSSGARGSSSGGGNSVCPRETPKWQKPITSFFVNKDTSADSSRDGDVDETSCSSGKCVPVPQKARKSSARNIISSDSEDDTSKNQSLNDTVHLEPPNGDTSHKIDEFYMRNGGKVTQEARKSKRIIVSSDSENDLHDTSRDQALGDTVHLEPLNGDTSHKIDEFYMKNGGKGKGVGKKSTNKENVDTNERRNSIKRDLEDIAFGEEPAQASKRVKVN